MTSRFNAIHPLHCMFHINKIVSTRLGISGKNYIMGVGERDYASKFGGGGIIYMSPNLVLHACAVHLLYEHLHCVFLVQF